MPIVPSNPKPAETRVDALINQMRKYSLAEVRKRLDELQTRQPYDFASVEGFYFSIRKSEAATQPIVIPGGMVQ